MDFCLKSLSGKSPLPTFLILFWNPFLNSSPILHYLKAEYGYDYFVINYGPGL